MEKIPDALHFYRPDRGPSPQEEERDNQIQALLDQRWEVCRKLDDLEDDKADIDQQLSDLEYY